MSTVTQESASTLWPFPAIIPPPSAKSRGSCFPRGPLPAHAASKAVAETKEIVAMPRSSFSSKTHTPSEAAAAQNMFTPLSIDEKHTMIMTEFEKNEREVIPRLVQEKAARKTRIGQLRECQVDEYLECLQPSGES